MLNHDVLGGEVLVLIVGSLFGVALGAAVELLGLGVAAVIAGLRSKPLKVRISLVLEEVLL